MKRSPMRRSSPSQIAEWKRRSTTLKRDGTQKRRPSKKDTAWRKACRDVDSRSGGWCEANVEGVCPPGRHKAQHHHHVRLRAQGGPDEAWNLLHVCHVAHTYIHANVAAAHALGLLRWHGDDPEADDVG